MKILKCMMVSIALLTSMFCYASDSPDNITPEDWLKSTFRYIQSSHQCNPGVLQRKIEKAKKQGFFLDVVDKEISQGFCNTTLLIEAVQKNYFSYVQLLLAAKANPNVQSETIIGGMTALHFAVLTNSIAITEVLLSSGAVDTPDLFGNMMARDYAASNGNAAMMRLFSLPIQTVTSVSESDALTSVVTPPFAPIPLTESYSTYDLDDENLKTPRSCLFEVVERSPEHELLSATMSTTPTAELCICISARSSQASTPVVHYRGAFHGDCHDDNEI